MRLSCVAQALLSWLQASDVPEPPHLEQIAQTVTQLCAAADNKGTGVLCHGDARRSNMLHGVDGKCTLVNLEMGMLGDPLRDLSQLDVSQPNQEILLARYLQRDATAAEVASLRCYRLVDAFIHTLFHWVVRIDAALLSNPRHHKEVAKQARKFSESQHEPADEFARFGVNCNPDWNAKFGEQYKDLVLKFRWMQQEVDDKSFRAGLAEFCQETELQTEC
eukprot:TRINITY_DN8822_c0_g1_i1.p1 TRINITY_DN8822_c0_g1~~TRINITY_DN8822_c0_g1_i1.p1  ORF type:complete len:220 (+),score=59.66 TRINITY_DN8822_c0_g1_i1:775-1434(+)